MASVAFSPFCWNWNGLFAAEILSRMTSLAGADFFKAACADDLSPVDTGSGSNIHDVIGCAHSVLIVLNNDEGVAYIAQVLEGVDKLAVIPLV